MKVDTKTLAMALGLDSLCLVPKRAAPADAQLIWVATESSEYVAGEVITITGGNFAPLETLTAQVTHSDGGAEPDVGHDVAVLSADANGAFRGRCGRSLRRMSGATISWFGRRMATATLWSAPSRASRASAPTNRITTLARP